MGQMTQDMAGLAGAIVAARRQRAEAASARRTEMAQRHQDAAMALAGFRGQRHEMARAQHEAAMAAHRMRRQEAAAMVRQCRRDSAARHSERQQAAAAGHAQRDAFMAGLMAEAAAMRQSFDRDRNQRHADRRAMGQSVHHLLADYAHERHQAASAWHRGLHAHERRRGGAASGMHGA